MNCASSPIDAGPDTPSSKYVSGPLTIIGVDDDAPSRKPSHPTVSRHPSGGEYAVTWMKVRPEVYEQMTGDGLSRDAMLAHCEGLAYVYRTERMDCRIARTVVRNILFGFDDPEPVIRELVRAGYWTEHATHFELVDHRKTVRESLTAQNKKRERDAEAQQKARDKRGSSASASVTDSAATQPNNLTTEQPARTRATAGRLAPDGRLLGHCGNCDHWEPLGDDALCDHCTRPDGSGRTPTEAEADLAPDPPGDLSESEWWREWGEAS